MYGAFRSLPLTVHLVCFFFIEQLYVWATILLALCIIHDTKILQIDADIFSLSINSVYWKE